MHNLKKAAIICQLIVFYFLVNTPLFSQDGPGENILRIDSYPQGASVYINNKYCGTTPLQILNTDRNELRIKATFNGVSREQIIGFIKGVYEVFFVLDGDYGFLNVNSAPDSAEVLINDTQVGYTPLRNWKLHLGNYKLGIRKKDYSTVEKLIFVRSTRYEYNIDLKLNYSLISTEDKDICRLVIDDNVCLFDSSSSIKVPVGKHSLALKPDNFFRPIEKDFEIESGIQYRLKSMYGYYSPRYLLMSAVVPGLGQFSDRSYIQGVGYFAGALISGIFFIKAGLDYQDMQSEFTRNKDKYFGARNEPEAVKYRALLESSLNDMNKAAKRKNLFLGAALGIYSLNIIDAVIFHSKGSSLQLEKIAEINAGPNGLGVKINLK
ncbi:MAG: PEGA domain-containing protein [Bacillota bacterium]